ncbi:MAG: T9SS type A sorting domain-containing protein [Bacteroidia bacterium]|nr:T9SS type A sorting domain-containing protein [Bacteroidia bacterium]
MKKSLLLSFTVVLSFLLSLSFNIEGQTVVFSENFSGFSNGTHASQSSYDYSGVLDTKTQLPGWTGYKVYSAGGEIKLGTSDVPGWIETPSIDLSGYEGDVFIEFDISRWPDDAAIVQVSLNGFPLGNTIAPADEFQTVEILLTEEITSAKIKFESLAKRFFLDNVRVVAQNATSAGNNYKFESRIKVYPNPAGDLINIDNLNGISRLEIINLNGRVMEAIDLSDTEKVDLALNDFPPGIYLIRFFTGRSSFTTRFVKYKK